MILLEFEAKRLLAEGGLSVPGGLLVRAGEPLPAEAPVPGVVKAQLPFGGRGRLGAIRPYRSAEEGRRHLESIFQMEVRGCRVPACWVEELVLWSRECYLSVLYDDARKRPEIVFMEEGGGEVEELAQAQPETVHRCPFDASGPPEEEALLRFAERCAVPSAQQAGWVEFLTKAARLFLERDLTLLEINPMMLTAERGWVAADARVRLDEEALFRRREVISVLSDLPRTPGRAPSDLERRAAEIDASDHRGVAGRLVEFDGDLGLVIGGGGASLTVFDAVLRAGGRPADYCEIGGNPSVRKVAALTRLLLSKPGVARLAVIMNVVSNTRVDLVARGVIKGCLEAGRDPAETIRVFRVPGAWEAEGFAILDRYGVRRFGREMTLDEAAEAACAP